MPRGFLGATGCLEEVKLVMVFAEPACPHDGECYDDHKCPTELLLASVRYAYKCFADVKDLIHQNARWFMQQLYPNLSYDEQLRRVWVTQSRLCSIANGSDRDPTCAKRYLAPQIDLLPRARVVAFGQKTQRRMQKLAKHNGKNADWLCAASLAPRPWHRETAQQSWEEAIAELKSA